MDHAQMAKDILRLVGGEENVLSLGHCTTRLRFKFKHIDIVDKSTISRLPGVIQIMDIAGQFQIVIGPEVNDVYREIMKMTELDGYRERKKTGEKDSLFNQAIDIISSIFTPLLGVMAGAGILKGLLIVAEATGLLSELDGTYQILHAASDSLFYFLPIHLALTSAKKFGADPHVAIVIAGALFYPDLMDIYNYGIELAFLGIPVILIKYATSVIPIILAIYVTSKFQWLLNKVYPTTIKTFFTPLTILTVMVPMTFLVFGPIGNIVSIWLGDGYSFIYEGSEITAGALLGFFWQILVIFGLHWGITPIAFNNLSHFGYDTFSAMITPAIFAQAGAALGVWLKTKERKIKAIAAPATVAGILGVTEPAIYGITLRYKRPFIIGCIAGALGGALAGLSGASSKSLALPGLTSLPVFLGDGFALFMLGVVGAFLLAAVGTYLFGYSEKIERDNQDQIVPKKKMDDFIVRSPLAGAVINLEHVNDDVFSSEAVGQGIAIVPVEGNLHAPFDGTIISVFPTSHGIGLTSDSGIQVLVHIGINTVQLDGNFFDMKVEQGDRVESGQLLGTFDIEGITKHGFDITSPVVITNSYEYLDVISSELENAAVGDRLLNVIK